MRWMWSRRVEWASSDDDDDEDDDSVGVDEQEDAKAA